MLIRIVRMTFQEGKSAEFLKIFESSKQKIRNFEGCRHLELLKDYSHDNVYSTYSYWESEEALNIYRKSEYFGEVWKDTKVLFNEKPIAFSSKKFIEVES